MLRCDFIGVTGGVGLRGGSTSSQYQHTGSYGLHLHIGLSHRRSAPFLPGQSGGNERLLIPVCWRGLSPWISHVRLAYWGRTYKSITDHRTRNRGPITRRDLVVANPESHVRAAAGTPNLEVRKPGAFEGADAPGVGMSPSGRLRDRRDGWDGPAPCRWVGRPAILVWLVRYRCCERDRLYLVRTHRVRRRRRWHSFPAALDRNRARRRSWARIIPSRLKAHLPNVGPLDFARRR